MSEVFTPTLWLSFSSIMLFAYWLVYCMGSPLADQPRDIDKGAILFFIPMWFAIRRLKENDLYAGMRNELYNGLIQNKDPKNRQEWRKQHREDLIVIGREFFTWERSLLCPICLHWWLTVLLMPLALVFGWSAFFIFPLQTIFVYLLNHFFIRKIA